MATGTFILLSFSATHSFSRMADRQILSFLTLSHVLLYVVALLLAPFAVRTKPGNPISWVRRVSCLVGFACCVAFAGPGAAVVTGLLRNLDHADSPFVGRVTWFLFLSMLLLYSVGLVLALIAVNAKSPIRVSRLGCVLNLVGIAFMAAFVGRILHIGFFPLLLVAIGGSYLIYFVMFVRKRPGAYRAALGASCFCIVVFCLEIYVLAMAVSYVPDLNDGMWSIGRFERHLKVHRAHFAPIWWLYDNTPLKTPIRWHLKTFSPGSSPP